VVIVQVSGSAAVEWCGCTGVGGGDLLDCCEWVVAVFAGRSEVAAQVAPRGGAATPRVLVSARS